MTEDSLRSVVHFGVPNAAAEYRGHGLKTHATEARIRARSFRFSTRLRVRIQVGGDRNLPEEFLKQRGARVSLADISHERPALLPKLGDQA